MTSQLFLALTAALLAVVAGEGYGPSDSYGGPGGPGPNDGGYKPSGSFNRYPSYGRYPSYFPPPPPPVTNPPQDVVDKLYRFVDSVATQNKYLSESLESLEARLVLSNQLLDELENIVVAKMTQQDSNTNNSLDRLQGHMDSLESSLTDLRYDVDVLAGANSGNQGASGSIRGRLDSAETDDIRQDGEIAALKEAIGDLKEKLLWVMETEFELLGDNVENTYSKAVTTKKRELALMCETGTITMVDPDGRAEYVFNSHFDSVPGVTFALSGLKADLDVRPPPPPRSHYGYGPPPNEPDSMGVTVFANPTKKGVTFFIAGFSFGDASVLATGINFQACSIPPSTTISSLHDVSGDTGTTAD